MISMLEKRRLEARAHDQVQRDAEEAAARARSTPAPRRELPRPVNDEPLSDADRLAALLVKDDRAIVTVADVKAVFTHFEARLDELDEL